MNEMNSQLSDW